MPTQGGVRRWVKLIGVALLAMWISACAGPVGHVTEATVEPAVETGLETGLEELTTDENKARLNELLALEAMETLGERLGRGLTTGAVSATGELSRHLAAMEMESQVAWWLQFLALQFEEEMGPAMEAVATQVIQAVLDELGSPQNRLRAVTLAVEVTEAVMAAIAAGLRGELGLAIRDMLIEHVGPGLTAILDDDFNAAIGETSRIIAREITIGTLEGIREVNQADHEEASIVEIFAGQVVDAADALGWLFWVLVVVGLALVVVLIGWATRLIFQARDLKRKGDLREETIIQLAEALKHVDRDGPESRELYSQISQQMDDDE